MFDTTALWNRLIAALLALAVVVLGFGHQHAPAVPADPMLAAYLQTGGTLEDLCLDDDPSHAAAQDCPVCTLAKAMGLSPDIGAIAVTTLGTKMAQPRAGDLFAHLHAPRAPPARAPPAVLA
jgi:hypothetical protein